MFFNCAKYTKKLKKVEKICATFLQKRLHFSESCGIIKE